MKKEKVDILEGNIPKDIMDALLRDHTTQRNIFWATKDYEQWGDGYAESDEITYEKVCDNNKIIPRVLKDRLQQTARSRDMAEVFTPSWVCNAQNNLIDNAWFGREGVFNVEVEENGVHSWIPTAESIVFSEGKTWKDYVRDNRSTLNMDLMNRKYPSSNPKSNQWSKGEMYLSYAKKNKNMNDTFKGIIIGVISSLIASGIIYAITESFVWNFTLPLWIWLCISLSIFLLTYTIRKVVICCKVKNFISEFTEGSFGNSYVYTWKYKRCRKGEYSAYGYEATDIHTKKPLAEMNNDRTITLGHEIPEETIKMIIQLLIIANIDKKKGSQLKNVLKYLDWTEDSSKHQLLH